MKFRLDHNVRVTEYLIQCAIAEILESNKVCHMGNYPEIKLNGKNVLREIKERVHSHGENGLEEWHLCLGYNVLQQASEYVQAYPDLLD
jgi:hypothetical protein